MRIYDRGTRRGWVVSSTPLPHFTPGKDPVTILQEAGWAPGPVWTGGKSRPHWDSIPDRPARSQSLYRLSYQAHDLRQKWWKMDRRSGTWDVWSLYMLGSLKIIWKIICNIQVERGNYIKMDHKGIGWDCVFWIRLAYGKNKWLTIVSMVWKIPFHKILRVSRLDEVLLALKERICHIELTL